MNNLKSIDNEEEAEIFYRGFRYAVDRMYVFYSRMINELKQMKAESEEQTPRDGE